jgi:hypothetical protein
MTAAWLLDRDELALAWRASRDWASGRAMPKPSDLRYEMCHGPVRLGRAPLRWLGPGGEFAK